MSRKTKATPLEEAVTSATTGTLDEQPSTHELTAEQRATLEGTSEPEQVAQQVRDELAKLDAAPAKRCEATKADKQCSLSHGHAGHHHALPAPDTIDAIVSWA